MKKRRLDDILIGRGLTKNKREAFVFVTEGRVLVNGQKAISPAQPVAEDDRIDVKAGREYVGRGAYKLEAALKKFAVDVQGKVCADIGSAVGGFVEVLLKYGAKRVYAIDTAHGKLDLKFRQDPRVVVMEGKDVRDIESLPNAVELVTSDVSLISLREILLAARRFAPRAGIVALFKPQYETRDPSILKHGVVKDAQDREKLLHDFIAWAESNGWSILNQMESPMRGSKGNIEYLFHLQPK